MTDRMFRLIERLQKLDMLIRLAEGRRRADPQEIRVLKRRKLRLRDRLVRFASVPKAMSLSL